MITIIADALATIKSADLPGVYLTEIGQFFKTVDLFVYYGRDDWVPERNWGVMTLPGKSYKYPAQIVYPWVLARREDDSQVLINFITYETKEIEFEISPRNILSAIREYGVKYGIRCGEEADELAHGTRIEIVDRDGLFDPVAVAIIGPIVLIEFTIEYVQTFVKLPVSDRIEYAVHQEYTVDNFAFVPEYHILKLNSDLDPINQDPWLNLEPLDGSYYTVQDSESWHWGLLDLRSGRLITDGYPSEDPYTSDQCRDFLEAHLKSA